jgi:hypothetical protein
MSEKDQPNRWRCLSKGCNPVLDEASAIVHNAEMQHRVAKWPVHSNAGKRKANLRNKNGYYTKYNIGSKAYENRVDDGHMSDIHGLLGHDYGDNYEGSVSFESGDEGHGQW